MTEHTAPKHTPDLPTLSAYLDGELDRHAEQRVAAHLAGCPLCAARFAELQALSADFKALPMASLGFDLAGVIEGRLAAAPRSPAARPGRPWFSQWPLAIGAAASIAAGVFMGSALVADRAAEVPRMAALRVFDIMPPGSLCIGLESCYRKESTQ